MNNAKTTLRESRDPYLDDQRKGLSPMKHTISVLVENKFGVLARIAGLFSGRGFNIDSLTVSPTQDDSLSRMTIVTHGEDAVLEQIEKQLNRLIEVVKVTDLTGGGFVSRELMLIKVTAGGDTRSEIIQIATIFKANVVNVETDSLVIQLTGPTDRVDAFVKLMDAFGIVELARTGKVALARSSSPTEMFDTKSIVTGVEPSEDDA